MSNDKVTLYHFTNEEALTDILLDGEIRPSGKSLEREGDDIWPAHNAPDISERVDRETGSPTSGIASPLGVGGSEISGGESRETRQSCAFSLRTDESPESGWLR